MSEYRAIYKCRLCGKEFVHCKTKEYTAMSLTVALTVNDTTDHVRYDDILHRHLLHNCADGSFGYADFYGFRKVE